MAILARLIRAALATIFAALPPPGPRDEEPIGAVGDGSGTSVLLVRPGDGLDDVLERIEGLGDSPTEDLESPEAGFRGVTSVEIAGKVPEGGDLAHLTITFEVVALGPGPHRVPIGLDGLYPREATSGDEPIGWESVPPEGWVVLLPGPVDRGRTIRVEVVVPIRTSEDRRRLSLSIPMAARTRLDLELPEAVVEATLGDGSVLPVEAIDDGDRSRIEVPLDPRDELDLSWLPRGEADSTHAPLLIGGGHLAIDVTDGALTARSQWEIQARRGEATALTLALDPEDEVLDVEVDGQPADPSETPEAPGRLRVPLPEPLRKGEPVRVSVTTRRRIDASGTGDRPESFRVRGHPFEGLIEQSGTLSIARPDGLRVVAEPALGLRRIDPRDLREEIAQARLTIVSAFRFAEQPFELALEVGPTPPMLRVSERTLVRLGTAGARVDAWLDYRAVRGQVFEVRIAVPPDFVVDRVGPPSAVSGWDESTGDEGPGSPKILTLTLASSLREGQAAPLRIELAGRVDDLGLGGEGGDAMLPLFRPLEAAFDVGLTAVATPIGIEVDPSGAAVDDPSMVIDPPPTTEPGPWSSPTIEPLRVAAWLRHERPLDALPVAVSARDTAASAEIAQLVRVGPDGVDVEQDLSLYVRDGRIAAVDLVVPKALDGRWELAERALIDRDEPLGTTAEGAVLRRLVLVEDAPSGPITLRLRFPMPEVGPLEPGVVRSMTIPRIEVRGAVRSSPDRVEVAAEAGVDLRLDGGGWRLPDENQWVSSPGGGDPMPIRAIWVGDDPRGPRLSATAPKAAALPEAIASRLWLRTEQAPDGMVRASAWFRIDDHGQDLGFALPIGGELDRAYLDGAVVPVVDLVALDRDGRYRLRLPAGTPDRVLLGLSYRLGPMSPGRWSPPVLLDGARVLETLWEVRLPWSHALVGVPDGFNDENRWYWGGYVWKRRPSMTAAALSDWVAGPGALDDRFGPPLTEGRIGDHGYLFGRPGGPPSIRPTVASRALLIGLCSGSALLIGLLTLSRRPWLRGSAPLLGLGLLGLLAMISRSAAILALQSSTVGLLLVAVSALTRRLVDRRRPASRFPDLGAPGSSGTAQRPGVGSDRPMEPAGVGSDDSTAIRRRPSEPARQPPPLDFEPTGPGIIEVHAPRGGGEAS